MSSPRTRRVLKDLKVKDDNNVSNFDLLICKKKIKHYIFAIVLNFDSFSLKINVTGIMICLHFETTFKALKRKSL